MNRWKFFGFFLLSLASNPIVFAQISATSHSKKNTSGVTKPNSHQESRQAHANYFDRYLKDPIADESAKAEAQHLARQNSKFLKAPSPLASGNELLALKCYQEGWNVQINETLTDPGSAPKEHKVVTEALRSIVDRGQIEAGAVLFRGQTGLWPEQNKLKAGDTFSSPRFLSTSLNPLVSKDFSTQESTGNVVAVFDVIRVNGSGLKGLDLNATKRNGAVSAPSPNLGDWNKLACASEETNDMNFEAEVILPPNAQFRILKIEKKKSGRQTWLIRYLEYIGN